MSPDRKSRILRTLFQSIVGAVLAVIVGASNVVGEGKEFWVPVAGAVLATLTSAVQNWLNSHKEEPPA